MGEPVVCIHGAFIAHAFRPLFSERSLADRYRLISYHRRGYVRSSPIGKTVSLAEEADDCRNLLSHLGVRRAHVVGHSFGGAIALQLALDAPQLVHTLSLLEAALMVGESAPLSRQALADSMHRYREAGPRVAVDESRRSGGRGIRNTSNRCCRSVCAGGRRCRDLLCGGCAGDPRRPIRRCGGAADHEAALVVLGEKSVALHPRFAETNRPSLGWLPNAEGFILPHAATSCRWKTPRPGRSAHRLLHPPHPQRVSAWLTRWLSTRRGASGARAAPRCLGDDAENGGGTGGIPTAAGPNFFAFADDALFASLLEGAGLTDVTVDAVEFGLELADGDELWDGLLAGAVRVRPMILGQPEAMRREIHSRFAELLEAYRAQDGFDVPVSVKLASGTKE